MIFALLTLNLGYELELRYADSRDTVLEATVQGWEGAPVALSTEREDGTTVRVELDCSWLGPSQEGVEMVLCAIRVLEDEALVSQPRVTTLVGQEASVKQGRRGRLGREDFVQVEFLVSE